MFWSLSVFAFLLHSFDAGSTKLFRIHVPWTLCLPTHYTENVHNELHVFCLGSRSHLQGFVGNSGWGIGTKFLFLFD